MNEQNKDFNNMAFENLLTRRIQCHNLFGVKRLENFGDIWKLYLKYVNMADHIHSDEDYSVSCWETTSPRAKLCKIENYAKLDINHKNQGWF